MIEVKQSYFKEFMTSRMLVLGVLICLFVATMSLSLVPIVQARIAAAIVVTTTSDVIAYDGQCALREAIIAANTDSSFNDCQAGSGADTISFAENLSLPAVFSLTITGTNEDLSYSGDLDILGTLSITGSGSSSIILDGQEIDRVLDIRPGAHATISGITVRNGNLIGSTEGGGIRNQASLVMNNCIVTDNHPGGIFNNGGGLTLTDVSVTDNKGSFGLTNLNQGFLTFDGGDVSGNQGGISNATATAILSNLVISNNVGGGGVSNSGTTLSHLTLSQSSVNSNASTNGGGVFNSGVGAITSILETTISDNSATAAGGGVYNNGTMTINSSTLDHNQARSGGGIDHRGTSLHMTNDTISSNTAADNGGGFYNRGSATITHVTFSGNGADGDMGGNIVNDEAFLTFQNSIVANADNGSNCSYNGGFVTSSGNNLEDGNTCAFNNGGDIINSDPHLGPLQDNGGPTLTHALTPGSPALDKGNNAFCTPADQRDQPRPPTACDIGAYEATAGATPSADLAISATTAPAIININDIMTYTMPIVNHGPSTANLIVITDSLPAEVGYIDAFMSGGGSCVHGSVVTCTLSELASGDSETVMIIVNAPASPVDIINQAQVTSATPDLKPENNSVTIVTAVSETTATTDLAISATTAPAIIKVNDVITYTMPIVNHGPSTANLIVITDSLPAEVGYIDAFMSGGGSCVHGSVVTCTLSELASGGSETVMIIVNAPAGPMDIINQAQVTSATPDLKPENNSVTTITAVVYKHYIYLPIVFRN